MDSVLNVLAVAFIALCLSVVVVEALSLALFSPAALVVAETIAAKKAERDAEMRRLAEEEAKLAKQRMFMGYVYPSAVKATHT